jgi:hypothetical protein
MQNGRFQRLIGSMYDELLNKALLLNIAHTLVEIAASFKDCSWERLHPFSGYTTPAVFAAEPQKPWLPSLRPIGPLCGPMLQPHWCARQPPGSNPG